MKTLIFHSLCVLALVKSGISYSKYGRTCKDIGCTSSEVCVMAEDPCSYYNRGNDCGTYPTCQRVNNGGPSCTSYVCPPTKKCIMDNGSPKCVEDKNGSEFSSIDEKHSSPNNNANNQPSAPELPPQGGGLPPQGGGLPPQGGGGSLYPNLRPGQTTPRAPVYRPGQAPSRGGGYQGGAVGSGYPGQSNRGGYPSQGGGYPAQGGGYPSQGGYPAQGGGYPSQGGYPGGYPNGGYPQRGGYPQSPQSGGYPYGGGGYQQPGGYPAQGNYPYGRKPNKSSASDSLLDKITDGLKSWGLFCLVANYFMKLAFG